MTEFERLVKEMRDAQKLFFRSEFGPERQQALQDSKRLEKRVDAHLKEQEEGTLF